MQAFKRAGSLNRIRELLLMVVSATGLLLAYVLALVFPEQDQSALTALLFVCSIVFSCAWCLPAARNQFDGALDWLHPAVLMVAVYLAYFVFPGLWLWLIHDYQPTWVEVGGQPAFLVNKALILGATSMAAFGLGCRSSLSFPGARLRNALYQADVMRFSDARYLIVMFFVIGLSAKLYHLSLHGPISLDLLQYLSPTERRDSEVSLSQFVILLGSMLNWSLLFAMFYFLVRYLGSGVTKGLFPLMIFAVCVMLLGYLITAKRSEIIPLILLPFVWYHYLVKRLTVVKTIASLGVGVGLIGILLIARIALPLYGKDLIASDYIGENFWDVVKFYFDSMEWASFEMILASIQQREELLSKAGGSIAGFLYYSFGTLTVFVPRVFWPDKPVYEDLSHVYFRTILQASDEIGIAPTIWGASYLFFHVAGLVIGMYVLGWLFKGIYALFRPYQGRPYDVFFYAIFFWLAFQFLRFGTTGFLLLYFVQSIIVGVVAALFLARKRQGNGAALHGLK